MVSRRTQHFRVLESLLIVCISGLPSIGCRARVKVEHEVPVKMRDGVVLRTDIYRPSGPGKFPVLLMRTPYGNHYEDRGFLPMVARGYVVIIQQVRGRCGSEGEWYPFKHETEDGFDTVEWAAALPYSNGKVGMFGGSYPGATQLLAAMASPPHLAGIFPAETASDFHNGWVYQDGALSQWLDESWPAHGLAVSSTPRQWIDSVPYNDHLLRLLPSRSDPMKMPAVWTLPLASYPLVQPNGRSFDYYFRDWLEHPARDDYWKRWSIEEHTAKIAVPAFHLGGWYDAFLMGTIRNYVGIKRRSGSEAARSGQKLLIGPWTHASVYGEKSGEVDFGTTARIRNPNELLFRWYDHLLKGVDNGVETEKPVKIFVMGKNSWREEDDWPLARAQNTRYYLRSGGHANGSDGDGALSASAPEAEPPDQFLYDPADPVRTRGGPLCCDDELLPSGPLDQRPVEARHDVLVYTTTAFTDALEVTGPVSLDLFARSSAVDTDFTAKLVDVWPNGFAQNLTEGIARARYRNSREKPDQLTPGETYKFMVELWATSNAFLAGHRLRLEVSSSNFPRFDRNLNTGEDPGHSIRMLKATNFILHDREHPSALILPVVPQ